MDLTPEFISRCVFGREVSSSGTPHLQGYIVFRDTQRISALKKLFPRASWSNTKCDDAAVTYCMKDGRYMVLDFRRGRSSRSELVTTQPLSSGQPRVRDPPKLETDFSEKLLPKIKIPNLFSKK